MVVVERVVGPSDTLLVSLAVSALEVSGQRLIETGCADLRRLQTLVGADQVVVEPFSLVDVQPYSCSRAAVLASSTSGPSSARRRISGRRWPRLQPSRRDTSTHLPSRRDGLMKIPLGAECGLALARVSCRQGRRRGLRATAGGGLAHLPGLRVSCSGSRKQLSALADLHCSL